VVLQPARDIASAMAVIHLAPTECIFLSSLCLILYAIDMASLVLVFNGTTP
jgi:hypothetical protein